MKYWLAKTEPEEYGWDDLSSSSEAVWDGVRNYTARNNMQAMKVGDQVLIYHSGKNPEIVGVAEVTKEQYQDPKDDTGKWCAIKLKALNPLKIPVSLSYIKGEPLFENSSLVKISRLSIHQLSQEEYLHILKKSQSL